MVIYRPTYYAEFCKVARCRAFLFVSWFRCIKFSSYKIHQSQGTVAAEWLTGQIYFHPLPVLENSLNYDDQDMTGSDLAHINLPPNRSVSSSRSKYSFVVHLIWASGISGTN